MGQAAVNPARTFLFTDVEGSTRLWERAPASMRDDLAEHDQLLAEVVADHDGSVFKFRGDGVAAVFQEPGAGVAAAVAAQRSLAAGHWRVGPFRVRMGLHSGEAQERDGDWFGPTVNRTARLHDVAHGGQIVVSGATAHLVAHRLPADITLLDLGEHRLRDLVEPEHIHQVLAPDLSTRFSPLRTEHHPSRGVPAASGRLLGRAVERRRLDELVRANRTVTITGPPGGGKSRLAVELARDHRDDWPGGVWFCSLASLAAGATGIDGVASRLADLLGSAVTDGGTSLDAVVGALSERRALVVLDGCDHVLADAAAVAAELRDRCPQTAVLVTSRERLGITDEHLLDLPTLSDEHAITLFVERALAVRQDFDASAHQDAVRSLIANLDGLPLAIELAAARVRTHEPAEIDRLLQEQVRVLRNPRRRGEVGDGGGDGGGDGHQDLEAAIAWSHDLLDPVDQRAFRHLSVFAGAFTPADLAMRVPDLDVEDCTDLLDSLVDRSLVALAPPRSSDRTSRYRLLTTLRAYARRRLDDQPDASDAWALHTALVVDAARAAAARLCGPDEVRWVQALADQWEDLRAVVRRAIAQADVETLTSLLGSLMHHSTMRGPEVGEWAEATCTLPAFWSQPDAATVAGIACEARIRRADFAGVLAFGNRTLEEIGPDHPSTWLTHSSIALATLTQGDLPGGLAAQSKMRRTARAYRGVEPMAPAVAAYMTVTVRTYGGMTDDALRSAEEVAQVAFETGCPSIEAMALLAEGRSLVPRDPARSRLLLERALDLATGVANPVLAAQARWTLAELATTDDPEGALRVLQDLLHELHTVSNEAHGQQMLLRTIGPLLAVGADDLALLTTVALDTPAWDTTVLHRVAKQRVADRRDADAWRAAVDRAAELGMAGVRAEVTSGVDALLAG